MNVSKRQARWLDRQLEEAREGRTFWVSRILQEIIPFNRPHRLSVVKLGHAECVVRLPLRRRNLNHLRTIHACALATAAEYASGLCLLSALGVQDMRLIMSSLNMKYTRRAESECLATASLSSEDLTSVKLKLEEEGRAMFVLHSVVRDAEDEIVAKAEITWHVKQLNS